MMTLREKIIYFLHAIGRVIQPRLTALEKRIEALEANPFQYAGTHEANAEYTPGEFVTFRGSLWHCNTLTTSKPGTDETWTLAVKKGRDGKDAQQ